MISHIKSQNVFWGDTPRTRRTPPQPRCLDPVIMEGIANHFPIKMHYIAGFCLYNLKNFPGILAGLLQKRPRCLDPDTNFRLARHAAFPLFPFCETTAAAIVYLRGRLYTAL